MSLRTSRVRTPAFLAVHRRTSQKCIGPTVPAGKARNSLNALKHEWCAHDLQEETFAAAAHVAAYRLEKQLRKAFEPSHVPHRAADAVRQEWTANAPARTAWHRAMVRHNQRETLEVIGYKDVILFHVLTV